MDKVNKELIEDNLNLSKENTKQKEMIDRQWKLLEQCGVSAGGELKRVSYLLENLRKENARLKEELEPYKHPDVITLLTNWRTGELDRTHNKIANERDIFRQTLREIKEITDEMYEDYRKRWDDNISEGLEQILDLIYKAEKE